MEKSPDNIKINVGICILFQRHEGQGSREDCQCGLVSSLTTSNLHGGGHSGTATRCHFQVGICSCVMQDFINARKVLLKFCVFNFIFYQWFLHFPM